MERRLALWIGVSFIAIAWSLIAVVAHGGVSRCLRAYALGLDPTVIPSLESPQDRVLILTPGAMRWL